MSTVTVELSWSDGVTKKVDVEPVGDWFGVHDNTFRWDGEKRWQLVHLATGAPLPRRFYTRDGAVAYATEITGAAVDWSCTDRAVLLRQAKDAGFALLSAVDKAEKADLSVWCDQPLPDWPHTVDGPVTADRMARFYTVQAALLNYRVNDLADGGALDKDAPPEKFHAYFDVTLAFLNAWTAAYLLRAFQKHAPVEADDVACDLWAAVESGDSPQETWYDWLVRYRIDPAKVEAKHVEAVTRRAAQLAGPAEGEAAPSDA